ncbi:Protein STU1, partial [Frankliniella fusca]
ARPSSTWGGRRGLRGGGSSGVGPANVTSSLGSVRGGLGNLAYTRLVGRQPPVRGEGATPLRQERPPHPSPPLASSNPTSSGWHERITCW